MNGSKSRSLQSPVSRLTTTIAIVILSLGVATPALADGIVIPDPPPEPWIEETPWLTIRYHRVDVTIEDQVAITRVEQEFVNEYDWEAEGTYVFPLPEGAAVSEFAMWVDGTRVEGKILDADEARFIYESIVRERRDPALLEYVGRGAVQARVFPIPPGGSRKIDLEYTQVLPVENGLVRYVYPLNTEKFSAQPLEEVSVRVEIRSQDEVHAVYSPTHQDRVYIERKGDYRAVVGYEEYDVLPDQDFDLVYTVSHEDVGVNLLTYKESGEDGFFLLLAAPTVEVERVIPRDVILVLDVSGSMDGEKIEQAKDALTYVLDHLNKEDRFNVIAFSTGLQSYARRLRPVSEVDEAVEWVEDLEAIGGTDINRALLEALDQVDDERPTVLIFLTDGLPTEGVIEIDQILSNVEASAPGNARLFPFGVGDDVNTVLLDTMAEQQRGTTGYVRSHERIDEEVSAFYAKISTPVLADIELDFGDVMVEDVYPYPLPDLFAGTQLILVGRYRGSGATKIKLTGEVDGKTEGFTYEGRFRSSGGDDFIPRLWATRKIGYLLSQIRLHGEREEWVDAVVDLSVQYGIITPYTSFLIDEDDILTEEGRDEAKREYAATPSPAPAGAEAVERADDEGVLKEAESAGGGPLPEEAAEVVKQVGSKTFLLQDGVWIDTTFDPSQMTTVKIGFGSDAYFDLLAARPDWGLYFAVGDRVIFVSEGTAYEVVEGEGGPVEIPPTLVPGPTSPAPDNPRPRSGQDQPTATPVPVIGRIVEEPVDLSWVFALVAAVLVGGVSVLAGAILWWRLRR
jgi:Ca-activated chloride channel family protein